MSIFQIAASLFALFMMYTVQLHFKRKTLSQTEAFGWHSIWFFFIIVALFPALLYGISNTLHFTRVFDLLLVLGLMILTAVTFTTYFSQKKIEQRIEVLVRSISLSKINNKNAE